MRALVAVCSFLAVLAAAPAAADMNFDLAECAHFTDGSVRLRCFDGLTNKHGLDDWQNGTVTMLSLLRARARNLRVTINGVGETCALVVTLSRGGTVVETRNLTIDAWPVVSTFNQLAPETAYTVVATGEALRTSCFGNVSKTFTTEARK